MKKELLVTVFSNERIYNSKLRIVILSLFFTLCSNIALSEIDIALGLACNKNVLSSKSQKIWNERTIIAEEATSYLNILDKRIERLARSSEIARLSGQLNEMQEYDNQLFQLQKERIRADSRYKTQISKLNNALTNGKDSYCFRSNNIQNSPKQKLGAIVKNVTTAEGPRVRVEKVGSGSLAEQIGIKVGDEILALNSQTISNARELISILHTSPNGALLDFKLSRNGIILFAYSPPKLK